VEGGAWSYRQDVCAPLFTSARTSHGSGQRKQLSIHGEEVGLKPPSGAWLSMITRRRVASKLRVRIRNPTITSTIDEHRSHIALRKRRPDVQRIRG